MKKLALTILIVLFQLQLSSAQQLTYTQNLVPFTSVVNEWSDVQSFTISDSNLTGHVYLNSGDAFGSFYIFLGPDEFISDKTLEIIPVNGSVNATIYVRLFSTEASDYTGIITVQGIGLMDQTFQVSGTTSAVTAITSIQDQNFQIYPNPTSDYLLSAVDLTECEVLDMVGNIVTKGNGTKIDVSMLQPGIYFLRSGNRIHKFHKK
jgi:hypothetical protein